MNLALLKDDDGLTLVELIVAMGLMLVVFFAALTIFEVTARNEPELRSRNAAIQDAQIAVERMARELRQTSNVLSASASSVTVETYVPLASCAGTTTGSARSCRVTYSCSSGTCSRTVSDLSGGGAHSNVVATGLGSDEVFTYSPNDDAPGRMTITFQAVDEGDATEDAITIHDGVNFRNVSSAPDP